MKASVRIVRAVLELVPPYVLFVAGAAATGAWGLSRLASMLRDASQL